MPDPTAFAAATVALYTLAVFHLLVIHPRLSDAAEHRRNHIGARRHRQTARRARAALTDAEADLRHAHLNGSGEDVDVTQIEVERRQAHVDRINQESAVEYGPRGIVLPVHPRRAEPAKPAGKASRVRARRLRDARN